MRYRRAAIAAGALALPLAFALPARAHQQGHDGNQTVNFRLNQMNKSGSSAEATLSAMADGSLHVKITGTGFTPNAPHAQHTHGAAHSQEFFCPPPSADKDGDGQVATEEGLSMYGGVMLSLTTTGNTSAASGLAVDRMPVADAQGGLTAHHVRRRV
jgi:hypothetical protein